MVAKTKEKKSGFVNKYIKKEFIMLNVGILMTAFGIHAFRNPNKFASGGISGLALVLSVYFPNLTIGTLMLTMNLIILAFGWFFLGKESGVKSMYGIFVLSGLIWLLEFVMPLDSPLTNEKFMEFVYSVFIPGFGAALVFHAGASTGGTDIVAQVLKKVFKIRISYGLLIVDMMIAISAGFKFGVQASMYSIMGVCLRTFLLNSVLESLRIYKIMVIISDKSKSIYNYIINEIERGATIHSAQGAYTVEQRQVITTVLNRKQALALQEFIKKEDPEAFITISNSTEIIGKGFEGFE
jgi:uncharacterized membrane-anchored protein YitT (DUF2179 family)